ncbi:UNVERIFIED_CONTAM: hypothetical protein FKN15_052053 [Acipenser sinensis]
MALMVERARRLGWILLKAVLRFSFMVINNLVAIPSYVLYLIVLQPVRLMDSDTFWYIEGVMFKWLLAMVSSWGWAAGYTGISLFASLAHQHTQRLRCWLRGSTIVRPPQRISMTTVWIELSRVHLWGLQVGTFHPQCFVD